MDLDHAIKIAVDAHAGQLDRAGKPYILHPLRVMLAATTQDERIVGVLHDVVEDSSWTLDDLRLEGLTVVQVSALDAVTRREGEDYTAFIARAAIDPLGRAVKILDLMDNSSRSRIAEPSTKDQERFEKYQRALERLTLDPVPGQNRSARLMRAVSEVEEPSLPEDDA